MTVTATHDEFYPRAAPVLYFSLELGWNTWKLALTSRAGTKPPTADPQGPQPRRPPR